jgi:hypothetical protein
LGERSKTAANEGHDSREKRKIDAGRLYGSIANWRFIPDGSIYFFPFFARYVRVYLLPDQRDGRQTPVQRKTQNPVFNHGFTYELAHREVLKRTLMLKVQDLNRSTHRHHVIGQVLLPLSDLNLIKGVHIWKRIRPTDQVSLYKQYRPLRRPAALNSR